MRPAAILLATLSGASCLAPPADPVIEGNPGSTLSAIPPDVSTGFELLEVDLRVTGRLDLDSMILDPLARGATLATWPDLTPLETVFAPSAAAQPGTGIAFQPKSPAGTGWFALLVPKPPVGVRFDTGSFHALPDGRAVARVHLGSAPMLRDTSVCPKLDDTTAIIVELSEAVTAPGGATPVTVTAGPAGAQTACPKAGFETPASPPLAAFEFICPKKLAPKDVVTVSVLPGVASASGASVPAGDSVHAVEAFRLDLIMAECSSLRFEP